MSDYVIEAEVRTVRKKKVSRLRNQGLVPCTVYGPKIEPVSIQTPYRALELTLRQAGGTNLIKVKANGETFTVLTREVQRDVLKGTILHVDFFAVDESNVIRAAVPVYLVGSSPVAEARLGVLMTGVNAITIETLPSNLLNQIEVDVSGLEEVGAAITVADLDLGEDIVIIDDPDEMLARVVQTSAARAEADLEDAEELPYDEESFMHALREGITPGGERLSTNMPRWEMSDGDLEDLIAFLKTLP